MNDYNRPRFLLARWSIYAILTAIYMLAFFHRMAPAVISSDLMKAFNTSGAALGSLAAMYFFSFFVTVSLTRQHRRNMRLLQETALLKQRLQALEAALISTPREPAAAKPH